MSLIEDLKLALTGDIGALIKIEKEIFRNRYTPEEINHIRQLFTEDNLKNNSYVYYLAALTYHQQNDYAQTITLFEQAITLGNIMAMNSRALMHFRGEGGPINYTKAIALFDQAITLGNPEAMINRADMHCVGHGGPTDYAKAIVLYEKAIDLGHIAAAINRACMHCAGQGGPVDFAQAIALYEKAILLGNTEAMNNRAFMYCEGQGGPVDYPKAIALLDKAIDLGNSDAMNNRAVLLCAGNGGPVNHAKAILLLNKAIVLGNSGAMSTRASLYHKGIGGPVDYPKAIALLDKAILLSNRDAMLHRAYLQFNGLGEPINYDAAAYLYRKAYLLDKNDGISEVALTNLRLLISKPKAKYHWAMVKEEIEVTKLIKKDPQRFLRFLAEDDLIPITEKYPYISKILKLYPYIKAKISDQNSIALLKEYFKEQVSLDDDIGASSLMSIDVSIWLYLASYLSHADKASLRLVCQFFLRNVLLSPPIWKQWVEVNQLEVFQQRGKQFGWGTRPIYGVFYSPYSFRPKSLPSDFTELDLSQCEKLFKTNSVGLLNTLINLPKQLTYLKLQYAANVTKPVITFLLQNYPNLYIDFAGNNLLFWACYWGWQDIVVHLLEQITSQQGPFAKLMLNQGNGAVTPLMIANQQGHMEIVKLLAKQDKNESLKEVLKAPATHRESPAQPSENFLLHSVQMKLAKTKLWIYNTANKIAHNHHEAWHMAFKINLWLEYLALTPFSFSLEFNLKNAQLFAILLFDVYLKGSNGLNMQNTVFDLEFKQFSIQEFNLLKDELHALQLQHVVTLKPILETLEKMLLQLPQIKQIKNMALHILCDCNLISFSILAEKEKICAAILAVARFQILKKLDEAWPNEYVTKTKMTFDSFKEEYDLISQIAPLIQKSTVTNKQGCFFASTDSLSSNQHVNELDEKNSMINQMFFQ